MRYAMLGGTGLPVSRLSFGAMTFAGDSAPNPIWKNDRATAQTLVRAALDAGVNCFDTADAYAGGQSEIMLGETLRDVRDDVVISTKVGFRTGEAVVRSGLGSRHVIWSVEQSLKRLGTDWIDVLVCHRTDPLTPLEETLAGLDAVVRSGKVRHLAFSNWPAWKVAAAITAQRANGLAPFTHGQVYWSLVGREVEQDIVPMARHFGIGLTVWSPLASGFLSGKYGRENAGTSDDRRASFAFPPIDLERGYDIVDLTRQLAAERGASPAQVALAWLLARPGMTSVVVGASRIEQLHDNLASVDLTLDDEALARLDAASQPARTYPAWWEDVLGVDRALTGILG